MKKILVLGLGKSGKAVLNLLKRKKYNVVVYDDRKISYRGIKVLKEREILDNLSEIEFAVISPGIDPRKGIVKELKKRKVKIFSEVEVAYWFLPKRKKIISITGTNGKTTTSLLISKILKELSEKVVSCGNIGLPVSEVVLMKKNPEFIVVELSSFQLEHIEKYSSDIRILLNLSSDHTDRYKNNMEYYRTKFNIFNNLKKKDFIVLNYYDTIIRKMDNIDHRRKILIGKDIILNGNRIRGKIRNKRIDMEIKRDKVFLNANRENILSAVSIGVIFGVKLEKIKKVIENFRVPPHRMEIVRVIDGIKFINDSKSTNVSSVLNALKSVDRNVILILGGKDKMLNYRPIFRYLKKIKTIVLYGEAGRRLKKEFIGELKTVYIEKLLDALNYIRGIVKKNDTVLFSPGCSSFDQFNNYKERGDFFKRWVKKI